MSRLTLRILQLSLTLLGTPLAAAQMAPMMGTAAQMAGPSVSQLGALSGHPFDVAFVQAMTLHHRGAVQMARQELAAGTDGRVRKAAAAVVAAQQREIGLMSGWLKGWRAAAAGGAGHMALPGKGQTDRWFLNEMIPHHQSAVQLARLALVRSQDGRVRSLARQIIAAQTAETLQYRGWLRAMP